MRSEMSAINKGEASRRFLTKFSVSGMQKNKFYWTRDGMQDSAQWISIGIEDTPLPLPHRYIGIIELERKSILIYGAQSVTGKILISKNLGAGKG
jgi:hypothetical protein